MVFCYGSLSRLRHCPKQNLTEENASFLVVTYHHFVITWFQEITDVGKLMKTFS